MLLLFESLGCFADIEGKKDDARRKPANSKDCK